MGSQSKNAPCSCGSGKKYKNCCLEKDILQRKAAVRRNRTVLLIFLIAAAASIMSYAVLRARQPGPYDDLAKCLTEKGFVMYGAHWCGNCNEQKAVFGKSFKYINYVECSPDGSRELSERCESMKIRNFPTWFTRDKGRLTGVQSASELREESSCETAK